MRTLAEPRYCSSCLSSHIGSVPCGMTWLQRIKSQRVDPGVEETKTKRKYWNPESVDTLFQDGLNPNERRELMMEETNGVGYVDDPKSLDPHSKEQLGRAIFGKDE